MIGTVLALAVAAVSVPSVRAASDVTASEPDAAYRAGIEARSDEARARPHFVRAAEGYEAIWDQGTRSPAVARNMAQSRLLAGDLGRCIRDYRRGLRAFPHDRDLQRGLAFARARVAYPAVGDLADAARPPATASPLDRLRLPLPGLVALILAAWTVGWFVVARAWFTVRGGLAVFGGGLVLGATALGGWLAWEDGRLRADWSQPAAVVIGSDTDLRTGNSDEYPKRLDGRLPVGVEMKVLGERGGWVHVELSGGPAGWVPRDRVVPIP